MLDSGTIRFKQMKSRVTYCRSLLFSIFFSIAVIFTFYHFNSIDAGAYERPLEISTWSALQEAINGSAPGDTIILNADLTAGENDTAFSISKGINVVIDLNGHTIDRNMKALDGNAGTVFSVEPGAVLTIKDSSKTGRGIVTGGYAVDGGGILNIGTLILEGGCITGNRSAEKGGGIGNYSLLIVKGGIVTGNSADEKGGGIFNGIKGRMTLEKDTVYGNNAPKGSNIWNLGAVETVGGETLFYKALSSYMDTLAVLPSLLLLIVLFFAVALDNYLNKSQKRTMYFITILVFVLVIQDYLDNRLYGSRVLFRTLVSIIGFSVRPAILALYLHLLRPDRKYRLVWTAVGINAALYMTALFSPLTFHFSGGHFQAGPLHQSCLVISAALFVYCIYLTSRVFHPKDRKETWIPVFALVIISLAVVMDYTVVYHYQPISFLTIAISISCLMYYIWLHLQFVREHERALEAEHRIQIMMTQIQPHFLFNTLNSVMALCSKDTKAAMQTLGLFSIYLRQNLEALDAPDLIPLARELEHTRVYTKIEMIRFPNIRIEYDIRDEAFCVPALTVQPLVENAIRHGVRSRAEGIVTISTFCEGNEHHIVIRDNGVGFDTEREYTSDGTHIGIKNVRERLEVMCGGNMEIDSIPGEGTTIVLRIPTNGGDQK